MGDEHRVGYPRTVARAGASRIVTIFVAQQRAAASRA
jgi:hypothetical protein